MMGHTAKTQILESPILLAEADDDEAFMEKCTIKLSGTNDGRNYGGKSLLWKKPYGDPGYRDTSQRRKQPITNKNVNGMQK